MIYFLIMIIIDCVSAIEKKYRNDSRRRVASISGYPSI